MTEDSEPKRLVLARALVRPTTRLLMRPIMVGRSSIFMLHRRADPDRGIVGRTEAQVRDALDAVRASGASFRALEDVVDAHARTGVVSPDVVCLTIDDGYADQARLARAALAASCPVTIFLITGFLDGNLWPWDQRLFFVVANSRLPQIEFQTNAARATYPLQSEDDRRRSGIAITNWVKTLPQDQVEDAVALVARSAGVDIPRNPPPEHEPLSWHEVRLLEQEGVRFGAHTVSHRILSGLSDAEASAEIRGSVERVQRETQRPSGIFAWPTGRRSDFGRRDQLAAEKVGVVAAVATDDDFASWPKASGDQYGRYELRRFSLPQRDSEAIECASYVERLKQLVGR